MERAIRHELSKQEFILDDRVDVPPTHRCGVSRRVSAGEMYKNAKNELLETESSLKKRHGRRDKYFCSRVPGLQ